MPTTWEVCLWTSCPQGEHMQGRQGPHAISATPIPSSLLNASAPILACSAACASSSHPEAPCVAASRASKLWASMWISRG